MACSTTGSNAPPELLHGPQKPGVLPFMDIKSKQRTLRPLLHVSRKKFLPS